MSDQEGARRGRYGSKLPGYVRLLVLFLFVLFFSLPHSCRKVPIATNKDNSTILSRNARLGLWLAKKSELIEHESAAFDLVMTAWFEPGEAVEPAHL